MSNSSSIDSACPNSKGVGGEGLRLPAVLDLAAARELLELVRNALSYGACSLNAGDVQRLSTPCAQVLFAAGVESERLKRPLRIINPSEAFETAINDLGLGDRFANWMHGHE